MAVGAYDQPGQYQFLNTYVPIPFEQMAGALQQRQRAYEQGASMRDSFYTALKDIELSSPDEAEYQRRMAELDTKLSDLMSKQPDLGSLEFKTELNKVIREQGRDKWWRQAQKNKPIYDQLLKDYSEAVATGKPWNYRPLQMQLEQFRKYGTAGTGELFPKQAYEGGDLYEAADQLGKGFKSQGKVWAKDDESGEWYVRRGQEGVALSEVAFLYGYEADEKGNLTLVQPHPGLMTSAGGLDMQRQAHMLAEQEGGGPERENEIFLELYEAVTKPLVYKHSGMTVTEEQRRTSYGWDKLGQEELSFDYYLGSAQRLFGDNEFKVKSSSKLLGLMKGLNTFLMTNPTTIPSALLGKQVESFLAGGAEEYMERGLSKEQAVQEIENTADSMLTGMQASGYTFAPINAVVRSYASVKKIATEIQYDKFGPQNPSEDRLTIANKLLEEAPAGKYSSKDYNALTKSEKAKLTQDISDYVEDWSNQAIDIPIRAVDPKTKAAAASVFFGFDTDSGVVRGKEISGPVSQFLTYDPYDTKKQFVLDDVVKEDDRIDYIGTVGKDNPYAPGLHAIKVNNKTYFVQVPIINAKEGHPLKGHDSYSEAIPFMLHDYGRHPSGIGDWFVVGHPDEQQVNIRTVATKEGKGGVEKVRVEYVLGGDNLPRDIAPGATLTEEVRLSELEKLYDSLFEIKDGKYVFKGI